MGGREAARVPELGQSHRARDKATTGEIQGRRVHWGLIIEWGGWGIMRNEEEVKDTPKALLPDRKSTRLNSSHTLASRMPSSA